MEKLFCKYKKADSGYIALITILIIGAVATVIATSLLLLGIGSARTSFTLGQSEKAKSLANTCSEEALLKIKRNSGYTGTSNLTLDGGNCTYTVTDLGGESREIQATGTVDTVVRKVKIEIDQISPKVNIVSWQEVPDF